MGKLIDLAKTFYNYGSRHPLFGNWMERLAQRFSLSFVAQTRRQLDSVSPTFCVAKWLQGTIHLENGETHSCHHCPRHVISLAEVRADPGALFNTQQKRQQRQAMLKGVRPAECGYCWRMEDAAKGSFSDRHYKSSEDWARTRIRELQKLSGNESVQPAYLEISFSSICQMSCLYCDPLISSGKRAELERWGPYPVRSYYQIPEAKPDASEYVAAFWKWWPQLAPHLRVLRITGGEPLLSQDVFRLFNELARTPVPGLELAINTNLMAEAPLRVGVEKVRGLLESKSIREFRLFASIDTYGDQAEYLRPGLDYVKFMRHLEMVFEEMPSLSCTLLVTFNVLCLFRFEELLRHVLEFRQGHPRARLKIGVSLLDYPPFLGLQAMPTEFVRPRLQKISGFFHRHSSLKGPHGFSPSEIDRFDRILAAHARMTHDPQLFKDLQTVLTENDRRRSLDHVQIFPELADLAKPFRIQMPVLT